jgi:hypothetical protein
MIIYISSYPRSGSSLMQQIVNNFFEKPWTEVDSTKRSLEKITGVPNYFENWRYDPQVLSPSNSLLSNYWHKLNRNFLQIYSLDKWIALYDLAIPPYTKDCRYLLPGCKDVLTPKNRQKLAAEKTYFLVKTHHLPYDRYFENEYVIQIVRHPGQVFLSYLNFVKTYNPNINKTLDEVIKGQVPYGSWSQWHQAWEKAFSQLENRFLKLKFEDVILTEKSEICQQIKNIINLDYNQNKQEPSFEELRRNYPKYYKEGTRDRWQEKYNQKQLNLIKVLHGDTMKELDYPLAANSIV